MQTQLPAQQAKQHQSEHQHTQSQTLQPQFEDNRPEAAAQLRLQSFMANSSRVAQLQGVQEMMATSELAKRQVTVGVTTVPLQRMEEEEPLQTMAEEPVQREQAEAPAAESTPSEAPSSEAPKPNNTGLPDQLKAGIEGLSGMSMDHVKVHYNSNKPAQLQAHAYAQGSEIHVAPGQEKHLPHEAWHVVQQAQGRVKPTMQMRGDVQVNDDVGLEAEADLMGERAIQTVVEGQNARPDPISPALQLQALASSYTKGLIPRSHYDTTTYPIQCVMNVTLNTNDTDKKSLSAEGKVKDFKNGTSAGTKGWVGVTKYRAWYEIESKDGKFKNRHEVGPLQNTFTNPEAGHVLAKQNGGNGIDAENIFAQDGGTNNSIYKQFENKMRADMNLYVPTDDVKFKCYLVGDNITQGSIADEGLSDASSISSDEEMSSSDEEMSSSD